MTKPNTVKISKDLYYDCVRYLPEHWTLTLLSANTTEYVNRNDYTLYSVLLENDTIYNKIVENINEKYSDINNVFIYSILTILPTALLILSVPLSNMSIPYPYFILIAILDIVIISNCILKNRILEIKKEMAFNVLQQLRQLSK